MVSRRLLALSLLFVQFCSLITLTSLGRLELALKQLLFFLIGWLLILFLSRLSFQSLLNYSYTLYLLNLLLLLMVPLFGKSSFGAKRWLDLKFFYLQPSEFFKFTLPLLCANLLSLSGSPLSKGGLLSLLFTLIPFYLTLKQPDLGTALLLVLPVFTMFYLLGINKRLYISLFLLTLIALPFIWENLKDYQKMRILAFLNPQRDYGGAGYQSIQSVIAVASGGPFGKGFGGGTQSQLMFLPQRHTDFIFSSFSEEAGFFLSSLLILSYLFITLSFFKRAELSLELGEKLFFYSVGFSFALQTLINLLMCLGLFVVVGLPLPLMSYGGSSVITFSLILSTLFITK